MIFGSGRISWKVTGNPVVGRKKEAEGTINVGNREDADKFVSTQEAELVNGKRLAAAKQDAVSFVGGVVVAGMLIAEGIDSGEILQLDVDKNVGERRRDGGSGLHIVFSNNVGSLASEETVVPVVSVGQYQRFQKSIGMGSVILGLGFEDIFREMLEAGRRIWIFCICGRGNCGRARRCVRGWRLVGERGG